MRLVGGDARMLGESAVSSASRGRAIDGSAEVPGALSWTSSYLRQARVIDFCCGLAAGLIAYQVRFEVVTGSKIGYLLMSLVLPFAWLLTVIFAGGYHPPIICLGTHPSPPRPPAPVF